MRLLLDTHVLIRWDAGEALSEESTHAIRSADQVYVSAVSGWEIAIKKSIGRLTTSRSVADAARESGFEELPMRLVHAERVEELPLYHRDPFDRMLVAQAQVDRLVLVTRDAAMAAYDVRRLEA